MSYDVQMFVLCNHYVDEVLHESQSCPRCYGRDFYFDIHFDDMGQAVLAGGTLKLQQELMKISIEEKGSNPFHALWGSDVKTMKDLVVKIMPNGADNKASIIAWISYWPLSLTATLLNNPFRRLWLYIYSLCSGVYDKISMQHAKDLV